MTINNRAQAILLLTGHLRKSVKDAYKPLTIKEWEKFAQWLSNHGIQPEDLLQHNLREILADWDDKKITVDRVQWLLERAMTLGLAIGKWEQTGLWILTRSEPGYPDRLKKRLRFDSPPVLFGCGNQHLLNQRGIAIVGSRDATEEDLAFASRLGGKAVLQGFSIVSGGARGIDEAAMFGALRQEGTAIGVLSHNLLRAATSAKYRKPLMNNNLVLISPFDPEASFDIGNAMTRNKYIYCLADAAIVVTASKGKGGTWNGAKENLKNKWVPLWVKASPDKNSGNYALVEKGARWLPDTPFQFQDLLSPIPKDTVLLPTRNPTTSNLPSDFSLEAKVKDLRTPEDLTLYALFLDKIRKHTIDTPAPPDQLIELLGIRRSQFKDWIDRAVTEGRVKKISRPVRYQWVSGQPQQLSLLDAIKSPGDESIAREPLGSDLR